MTDRRLLLLPLLAALVLAVSACGGDGDGEAATASTDVDTLLTDTFTGSKRVESGELAVTMTLEASGGESQLDGPVTLKLEGPFEAGENGALPSFALDASFEGAGQSLAAGATSTGDKGFLSLQGTDYEVENTVFQQFKAGFEQAQKQGGEGGEGQTFASLGMDPRKWLTNPRNEGEAKVGDTDTIRITGGIDMAALLDDVDRALEQASALGLAGAGDVPEKLTAAQRKQVVEAIEDPRVQIFTGAEDKILRRMVLELGVADAASGTSGELALDIAITDLNEDQDIAEPADAKPFDELLSQLGGLGALSGAGAAAGGGAGGSSSDADLEAYSECVTDAGEDLDKTRRCADLLAP